MQLSNVVGPLKQLDVFSKLTDEQILRILQGAERVVYRPGQVMIEDGQSGDAAYFILVGSVERVGQYGLHESHERFGHGILVGEMAMLVEHVHSSTVRAKTEVKALRISRAMLYRVMNEDPAIADCFIQTIKARLSVMVDRIRDIDKTLEKAETVTFDTVWVTTEGAMAMH